MTGIIIIVCCLIFVYWCKKGSKTQKENTTPIKDQFAKAESDLNVCRQKLNDLLVLKNNAEEELRKYNKWPSCDYNNCKDICPWKKENDCPWNRIPCSFTENLQNVKKEIKKTKKEYLNLQFEYDCLEYKMRTEK